MRLNYRVIEGISFRMKFYLCQVLEFREHKPEDTGMQENRENFFWLDPKGINSTERIQQD